MADTLETLEHLAIWTGKDPAVVAADVFAQMVLEKATELVVEKAEIPATWPTDPTVVPARARTICLLVASRTYTNRRSVISQSVGPISESIMAQMAAAMQLTEAEAEELAAMAGADNTFGGLWTITTTYGDDYPIIDNVVLPDSSGSDWDIPYAVEGETGAFDVLLDEPSDGGVDPDAFALLQAQVSTLMSNVTNLDTEKADQLAVDAALANKADASDLGALETTLANKAEQSDLVSGLAIKANTTDVNAALAAKADADDVTTALAAKADQSSVDAALALKASEAALEALEVIVNSKADQSTIDAALALKANLEDLGVQIRMTQPETGSGELWADTGA